jgi:predicted RNA-binding Zn ribbon-like protein
MVTAELITDFVNTRDLLDSEEALVTPADLGGWLLAHGLVPEAPRVSAVDLKEAKALREALRTLLLANNAVDVDVDAATAVLDSVARRAKVELRFHDGLPVLVSSASGTPGALGQILASVQALTADGSWARLKACRARDCEWAFLDNAKNHSRAWCSMSSCGNREKARLFRERHRHVGL